MIGEHLSDVEHVRKRPGMYIGDTKFFGFIHYLVASVNFFLYRKPPINPVFTLRSWKRHPLSFARRDC